VLRELLRRQTPIHGFRCNPEALDSTVQRQILRRKYSEHYFLNSNAENTAIHHHACCKTNDQSLIVDVSDLAFEMRHQLRNYTARLNEKPSMVGILAEGPGRAGAEIYSNMIEATFAEDRLDYTVHRCRGDRPEAVEDVIHEMNNCRPDVHGILVFYPIFQQQTATGLQLRPATGVHDRKASPPYYLNPETGVRYKTVDDYLRDRVVPAKDVEGVCHDYKSLWHRQFFRARGGQNRLPNDVYIPCTVTAVLKILETFHQPMGRKEHHHKMSTNTSLVPEGLTLPQKRWEGCTATVVNRSTILGRPLAALLALEGATVYSVDETSIIQFQTGGSMRRCSSDLTLNDCLRQSSVVVTAVPSENFQLDCDAIANHTTVIDVSEHSNVDHGQLLRKRGIRLIPNIGKVTVAALEHNLIRLHRQQILTAAQ
jgi:methylenetetrahydrofolate dehydrogenase (NAD+)